ncbi:MAG: bifunctional diguanylate cyclase/phosphodiesterase [Treponema sp.]|nr:bifunctional diguanylate cyclase/phosphodiesterase [Treponema sp.]
MDNKGQNGGKTKAKKNFLDKVTKRKKAPVFVFFLLIILYFLAAAFVYKTSRSRDLFTLFGTPTPVSAFTGIFSAIANISLIILVFTFGKIGLITSLSILLLQIPIFFVNLFVSHNMGSLSGLFTGLLSVLAIVIIYLNNSQMEKYQERLRKQAVTDMLTGLPSRFACTEMMNSLIKKGDQFAIVSIDLNNFKAINDALGHTLGDKILVEIGSRLKALAEESSPDDKCDFVARLGGDVFCLLIRNYESDDDIIDTIRLYEYEIKRKITVDGYDYFMTANFGYAEYLLDADDGNALYSCADAALHEIKRSGAGSNNILRFSNELLKTTKYLEMERKIRVALHEDAFMAYLQPQYDMSHNLRGFEALARLKDSDGSILEPNEFIPVAEEAGLIDRLDIQVFNKAACLFGEYIKHSGSDLILSTNVSVKHLMKNNFLEKIQDVLEQSGLPAKNVELEITESIMIESPEKALQTINRIQNLGMKVAIDDFGTGYSSLSYLNRFPVDILKIDKSFIDQMDSSESSKKYVEAIISLGHILNFKVTSEGVETTAQLETLKSINCDYIQGYIWGKPMPMEEAIKLIES